MSTPTRGYLPPPRGRHALSTRGAVRAIVAGLLATAFTISSASGVHAQAPAESPTIATTTTTTTIPSPTSTTTTTTTTTTPPTTTTTTASTTITPDITTSTTLVAPPPPLAPTTATTTTTPVAPPTTVPGPVAPPARNITVYPQQIEHILATIRYLESRGIYTLPPNLGGASGAYQFVHSTWNGYGGYEHAYLAPPHIQDERAAKDVNMFLAQFDNDVSMVPVMWYFPIAARETEWMDRVPKPEHGNRLTIREYQTRWLGVFASLSGQTIAPRLGVTADLSAIAGRAPELPAPHEGVPSLSFPVLGPSRLAVPACDDATEVEVADGADGQAATDGPSRADIEAAGLCTEQAPGIVFGVKLQPVLAVADGVVTDVHDDPDSGKPITVTVTDPDGTSYIYAGFNDDNPCTDDGAAPAHLRLSGLAVIGGTVRAGQVLGFMGDTDPIPLGVRADVPTDATVQIAEDAVAPHIRVTMIDIAGHPIDAFGPIIDALFRQTCNVVIGQWSLPPNGSGHEPVTIETTDTDNSIDSEWIITSTGQVTASGWGALVNPSEGCQYTPPQAFGPGAGGSPVGSLRWVNEMALPTDVWISLALQDETAVPGMFHR